MKKNIILSLLVTLIACNSNTENKKQEMNRKLFTILVFGCFILLITKRGNAQDTTKKRSVSITSSFKPVLKESAKINFGAAPPTADTVRPRLNYDIPNQNLLFPYQPGTLKPMALQIDTSGRWDNTSYIKAGFGSLKTPYVQAGFSFGDGHAEIHKWLDSRTMPQEKFAPPRPPRITFPGSPDTAWRNLHTYP